MSLILFLGTYAMHCGADSFIAVRYSKVTGNIKLSNTNACIMNPFLAVLIEHRSLTVTVFANTWWLNNKLKCNRKNQVKLKEYCYCCT
jgi:hypothetical protein